MRAIFLLAFFLCFANALHSQFVGVNKVNPEHTLDVRSTNNDDPAGLNISNQDKSKYVRFFSGSTMFPDPSMSWAPDKSLLFATFDDNTFAFTEYMRISSSGNVGIGTTNPKARLEVRSLGLGDKLILLQNSLLNEDTDFGIYFNDNNAKSTIGAYYNVDSSGLIAYSDCGDCSVISGNVSSAFGVAVEGASSDPNGTGVIGFVAEGSSEGYGIGVIGESEADFGKGMQARGYIGLEAITVDPEGSGIRAYNYSNTGETFGIQSEVRSEDGTAIFGDANNISGGVGVRGRTSGFMSNGVEGIANSLFGSGVYGKGSTNGVTGEGLRGVNGISSGNDGLGVQGTAEGEDGIGVYGTAEGTNGIGIKGEASGSGTSLAGLFEGNVHVNGNLSKSGGSFKIDHPLDPKNKYLYHSFVESPDMMNIYNGNTKTDEKGEAIIELPDYFRALNMEFRYQLTVIGEFAQAIVSEKIVGNSFKIKTDKPSVEVSWQVTGVRNDAFARKNRIKVEEMKEAENRGKFLNPKAFKKDENTRQH